MNQVITAGYFDLEKIKSEVWDRLPQKQIVNDAMKVNRTTWDYAIDQGAAAQYIRE